MAKPDVRHLEEFQPLTKAQFRERFMQRFYDPAFDDVREVRAAPLPRPGRFC
jgi:hypothetical protein